MANPDLNFSSMLREGGHSLASTKLLEPQLCAMALCFVANMRGVGISPPSLPLDLPLIVKLYMIQCKCKNKL